MSNLEVKDLVMRFQGLKAVDNISFSIDDGDITGLIGPNGAGKTTVLNCITGFYTPDNGSILFNGIDILKLKIYDIIKFGIGRIFQNTELISGLNVIDNVLIGAHWLLKANFFRTAFRFKNNLPEEKDAKIRAYNVLECLKICEWAKKNVDDLPFGIKKMVEIARALMSKPKLLLLDEPTGGMMPYEKAVFLNQILEIKNEYDFSILLIEHDIAFVRKICKKTLVMNYGKAIARGTPDEVLNNADVIKAYIGED